MRKLLGALDHPERAFPSILVAGTNGKGSTAATLASILSASGYRTALYTSPHLMRLVERWKIDGKEILWKELENAVAELRRAIRRTGTIPTYFEALTLAGFLLFRDRRCEVAVLEVGMGGRLDATNIVQPLAALITRVGLDHMDYLGDTIEEIAGEKGGIIHPGSLALTSNLDPRALRALRARARKAGVKLKLTEKEVSRIAHRADESLSFTLTTPSNSYELTSPLLGAHQLENVSLAVRAAEELRPSLPLISPASIVEGVRRTIWRGRLERVETGGKLVVVDGAHNEDAARQLASYIGTSLKSPRALVFGIMDDKDIDAVASLLFPLFRSVVLTRPATSRAASLARLRAVAKENGVSSVLGFSRSGQAFRAALTLEEKVIVVAGSLYLAGEALGFFDRKNRKRKR